MRVDDLDDRTHADIARRQLDDLAAIGLTWDEPAEWQTEHPARYDAAIARTRRPRAAVRMLLQPKGYRPGAAGTARTAGRVSRDMSRPDRLRTREPTRRDRQAARAAAAHRRDHAHGSRSAARRLHRDRRRLRGPSRRRCSGLQPGRRRRRRRRRASTRWCAATTCCRRRRGRPISPALLGHPEPTYAHVALVLNEDGARLAKRDGAVTLAEIGVAAGAGADRRIPWLAGVEPRRDARAVRPDQAAAATVDLPPVETPRATSFVQQFRGVSRTNTDARGGGEVVTRRASGPSTRARRPRAARRGTAGVRSPQAPHRAPGRSCPPVRRRRTR